MKNIIIKFSVLVLAISLCVLFMVPATAYADGPVTSITVTGAGGATTVANGDTLAMSAEVLPADADDTTVTWSVAPGTGTASIDSAGVLTGTGLGTVTVTAAANDSSSVEGTLEITISEPEPPAAIPVTSITVTGAGGATTVANGDTLAMSAEVLPADADDTTVTWSVAPGTGTASIDSAGVLTGTGLGTVTVTAAANDSSSVEGTLEITISEPEPPAAIPVTSITVTGAGGATTVANGDTLAMSAEVLPADADDTTVTWSVAPGTGTASIDSAGVLTGTGLGTVTVTAAANDSSSVEGTLEITIDDAIIILATITDIGPIIGDPEVGAVLTAGALTPPGTVVTYQWQISDTEIGGYSDIGGETSNTYTVDADNIGKYIRVQATDTDPTPGVVYSDPTEEVEPSEAVVQSTVPLGKTSTFAILAYALISDAGAASTVTGAHGGDVGLTPTSGSMITGLTKAHVSGHIYVVDAAGPAGYTINPTLLTTAKNDLDTAYLNAANRIPTDTFLAGDNQLGGKTLKAGVYRFGHASTANLVGTLTLDAEGDENAVFIFQASSDLVMASNSNVELINGARFCRVFWVVPSDATLNTGSTFVGHIFAYASIWVRTGATIQGQLLARTEEVTLDHNVITNGPCETITEEDDTPGAIEEEEETSGEEYTAASTTPVTDTVSGTVTGGQLPVTSTIWYNILLAGIIITLVGAVTWFMARRKRIDA